MPSSTKKAGGGGKEGRVSSTLNSPSQLPVLQCQGAERLTRDEEHDPGSEGAVEPLEGGEVGEGHDAGDDAGEARHRREDHKGPGGVPVSWGGGGNSVTFLSTTPIQCHPPHHPRRGRTYTVGLHVALVGHAVAPQALVGVAPRQAVLHPVVGGGGDHQQDVTDNRAEEAPSHEAVHPELEQRGFCRATVTAAHRQGKHASTTAFIHDNCFANSKYNHMICFLLLQFFFFNHPTLHQGSRLSAVTGV